jgi:hypothetical protein
MLEKKGTTLSSGIWWNRAPTKMRQTGMGQLL